jgi:hypothetical protein
MMMGSSRSTVSFSVVPVVVRRLNLESANWSAAERYDDPFIGLELLLPACFEPIGDNSRNLVLSQSDCFSHANFIHASLSAIIIDWKESAAHILRLRHQRKKNEVCRQTFDKQIDKRKAAATTATTVFLAPSTYNTFTIQQIFRISPA